MVRCMNQVTCNRILCGFIALGCFVGIDASALAADCNSNGVDDAIEIVGGTGADCDTNGVLDECEGILFVDDSATNGLNDGTSWGNGYHHLQDALAEAAPNCAITQIWVAAGTYKPDEGVLQIPSDSDASFQLINGVAIYGGFAGTETTLDERDIESNGTVLSGDLLGNDVYVACEDTSPDCDAVGGYCWAGRCQFGPLFADNAYTVVDGSGTDSTAVIDGFVIERGKVGNSALFDTGGGITVHVGSPIISNCMLRDNAAWNYGGAIHCDASSPMIVGCKFFGNYAGFGGGVYCQNGGGPLIIDSQFNDNDYTAVFSNSSNPTIIGCRFERGSLSVSERLRMTSSTALVSNCVFENGAGDDGGGVFVHDSDVDFQECEFIGNQASHGGGAYISEGDVSFVGCRFRNNIAFGSGGALNLGNGEFLVDRCAFIGNESTNAFGGAIYRFATLGLEIRSCQFIQNSARESGGAISANYLEGVYNSLFAGNRSEEYGGAISSSSSGWGIANCTFYANSARYSGGAISGFGLQLRNDILWGNTPDQYDSSGSVTYCVIQGGWTGSGGFQVFDEYPLFVNSNGPDNIAGTEDDNLRLLPGSPAIDRGSLQFLPNVIDTDLDGRDRTVDDPRTPYFTGPFGSPFGILDMGAYEFVLGDCDADGDADLADHAILDGCLTNPGDGLGVGCACLDLDSDSDVDLRDFGFFQMAFVP